MASQKVERLATALHLLTYLLTYLLTHSFTYLLTYLLTYSMEQSPWFVTRPVFTASPQAEGPPLVGCPRPLIQYIRSYPLYWRPFLHPQPADAPCRCDRHALIVEPPHCSINRFRWLWYAFIRSTDFSHNRVTQINANFPSYTRDRHNEHETVRFQAKGLKFCHSEQIC